MAGELFIKLALPFFMQRTALDEQTHTDTEENCSTHIARTEVTPTNILH